MFSATLREWKRKIEQLRQRWRAVRQENERLRKENEVLRRREKQWERERERLREENDRLRQQLEEAQRANKRQAAPFSRGDRKSTRLNSSHGYISYAVFCLKKKPNLTRSYTRQPVIHHPDFMATAS